MREVVVSTGKKFDVHPLKGRDVREIFELKKTEDWGVVWETLHRAGFSQAELDDLPFPDILALNRAVNAETYGLQEEIKN